MARVSDRLTRLERRRPGRKQIITMIFSDTEGNVTTAEGKTYTAAEWARLHPDAIQMTWGDEYELENK